MSRDTDDRAKNSMLPLLVATGVVVAVYIVLVKTIFKSSKFKGNAAMAGKTVIVTGTFVSL